MRTIERVMRVMTHVNIGATLGMAAWLLWVRRRSADLFARAELGGAP